MVYINRKRGRIRREKRPDFCLFLFKNYSILFDKESAL